MSFSTTRGSSSSSSTPRSDDNNNNNKNCSSRHSSSSSHDKEKNFRSSSARRDETRWEDSSYYYSRSRLDERSPQDSFGGSRTKIITDRDKEEEEELEVRRLRRERDDARDRLRRTETRLREAESEVNRLQGDLEGRKEQAVLLQTEAAQLERRVESWQQISERATTELGREKERFEKGMAEDKATLLLEIAAEKRRLESVVESGRKEVETMRSRLKLYQLIPNMDADQLKKVSGLMTLPPPSSNPATSVVTTPSTLPPLQPMTTSSLKSTSSPMGDQLKKVSSLIAPQSSNPATSVTAPSTTPPPQPATSCPKSMSSPMGDPKSGPTTKKKRRVKKPDDPKKKKGKKASKKKILRNYCVMCEVSFPSKKALMTHRRESYKTPYRCKYCPKEIGDNWYNLAQHLKKCRPLQGPLQGPRGNLAVVGAPAAAVGPPPAVLVGAGEGKGQWFVQVNCQLAAR